MDAVVSKKCTVCICRAKDGHSVLCQNIGVFLLVHVASKPRRTSLTNALQFAVFILVRNLVPDYSLASGAASRRFCCML
jgi:hypothetical protein